MFRTLCYLSLIFALSNLAHAEKEKKLAMISPPFALHLAYRKNHLVLKLKNTSSTAQIYSLGAPDRLGTFHIGTLVVFDQKGKVVPGKDIVDHSRLDRMVLDKDDFKKLDPGSEVVLHESEIKAIGHAQWNLDWDNTRFVLKSGHYRAHIELLMGENEYFDPHTKENSRMPGVWEGQLKSKEVNWEVP